MKDVSTLRRDHHTCSHSNPSHRGEAPSWRVGSPALHAGLHAANQRIRQCVDQSEPLQMPADAGKDRQGYSMERRTARAPHPTSQRYSAGTNGAFVDGRRAVRALRMEPLDALTPGTCIGARRTTCSSPSWRQHRGGRRRIPAGPVPEPSSCRGFLHPESRFSSGRIVRGFHCSGL